MQLLALVISLLLSPPITQGEQCADLTSGRWACIQCAWDRYRVCGQDPVNDPASCLAKRDEEITACDDRFPPIPPQPWNPRPHRKPDIEPE